VHPVSKSREEALMLNKGLLFKILPAVVLVALLASALAALPASGAAEVGLSLKSMRISIWPEYDDPRILVLYEGEFADGAVFPQDVKFPAPAGASIGQVCALTKPANEHLCQLYETSPEGDGIVISYNLPIPTFFLEYYYDGLQGQPDRTFSYQYLSPYPIERLSIEVQQPLRSSDFSLSPAYVSSASSGGFKYYQYTFNNVEAGQAIRIDGSYTKTDTQPSIAGQQSAGGSSSALAITGIIVGAVAVGAVGIMVYRRRPTPARATASRGPARPSRQPRQAQMMMLKGSSTSSRNRAGSFCTQCGGKLDAGDRFCAQCGAAARKRE
jgi:hypothetical protein